MLKKDLSLVTLSLTLMYCFIAGSLSAVDTVAPKLKLGGIVLVIENGHILKELGATKSTPTADDIRKIAVSCSTTLSRDKLAEFISTAKTDDLCRTILPKLAQIYYWQTTIDEAIELHAGHLTRTLKNIRGKEPSQGEKDGFSQQIEELSRTIDTLLNGDHTLESLSSAIDAAQKTLTESPLANDIAAAKIYWGEICGDLQTIDSYSATDAEKDMFQAAAPRSNYLGEDPEHVKTYQEALIESTREKVRSARFKLEEMRKHFKRDEVLAKFGRFQQTDLV